MRRITLLTVLLGIVVLVMPTYVQAQPPSVPPGPAGQIEALDQKIDQEIADRIADVDAEEAARIAADATLYNTILLEADLRIAGDNEVKVLIGMEGNTRQAADTDLQNQIDTIELTPGPPGPPGDDAGLVVRQITYEVPVGGMFYDARQCPAGYILVSGSCKFFIDPSDNGTTVVYDGPAYTLEGWACKINNYSGADKIAVRLSAICLAVDCFSDADCHPECQKCFSNTCIPDNNGEACESGGTCNNGECVTP